MSLKRKAQPVSSQDASSKKAKANFFAPRTASGPSSLIQPQFVYSKKQDSSLRLTTWNVNGIKSVDEKVLKKYLEAEDPDILVLTETKYGKGKPDIMCLKTRYKHHVWGTDPKAGQAGTAILSKQKPQNITIGLPTWQGSSEETAGRFVQLEFEHTYVIGTYVPNSGENFKSLDTKKTWDAAFKEHIESLDPDKPVIWTGDFNCIPSKKDLDKKAQTFWNNLAGLSDVERTGLSAILDAPKTDNGKLKDVWRHLHPDAEEFTHASLKYGAWRLDSFILSEGILDKAQSCEIRHELKGLNLSDHWPVTLDFFGPL
ncbi:DNase I-like protein [Dentipellis sp. KUC8613]|nr:DNase I-like protein [Dentipellis sp. KUC8613]